MQQRCRILFIVVGKAEMLHFEKKKIKSMPIGILLDAYRELDRQASDELDLMLKSGIPIDAITIINDSDEITITSSLPHPQTIRFEAGFGPVLPPSE